MKTIKAARFLLNRMPAHVILFVTGRCNARCGHCFYWRRIAAADRGRELSIDEIRKVSRSMGHLKMLSLTGGEPFLREDLAQIASTVYANNDLHHLVVHTNGLLVDRIRDFAATVVRECPELGLVVSLSLDDFEAGHDANRGVPGSFGKVLAAIDALQELRHRHRNFEVDITTAVSAHNYPRMQQLMDYVRNDLPVDAHHIELVRGDTRDSEARSITPAQFHDVVAHLRRTWTLGRRKADYPFASFRQVIDVLTPELEMETLVGNRMIYPCRAGRTVVVIGEEGDVYPCELLDRTFGNLRSFDCDMSKLLRSREALAIKRWIVESRCFCTWGCAVSNNLIFNVRAYPRIAKRWLELKRGSP